MSTIPIYALVDTWDNVGTTFKGISLDVTDTASASGSLLMDLQVGGVSRFKVSKIGEVIIPANAPYMGESSGSQWRISGLTGLVFGTTQILAWSNGNVNIADTILRRDAANTLAQRNGVNAQAFRLYNTFTDASNYERGKFEWASNVLRIGTEKAGTGTARALELQTDGVTRLTIPSTSGNINFTGNLTTAGNMTIAGNDPYIFSLRSRIRSPQDGIVLITANIGTSGAAHELIEMTAPAAPATNGVRIYAEDDGAGKTRLMALFATGAAQQIAIEP